MLLLSLMTAALAGSTAGMGLSPMGGAFGGVTEPGVLGLGSNPAAARSSQTEVGMDFGMSQWTIDAQLQNEGPIQGQGLVPMPYLGTTIPMGDFGLGLVGSLPYGGGGEFPEDGAQRFHLREGKVFLAEGSLALAYQPIRALRIGIAGRLGRGSMMKRYALDPAGLVYSKLGEDITGLSPDERLAEGTQELDISGVGLGYALGASVFLPSGVELHASYRSPMSVALSGPVEVVPSSDLDLALSGRAYASMTFAREAAIGLVIPTGAVRLSIDGGWSDWRTLERVDGTLDNVKLKSDDATLIALLEATGSDDSSLTDPQDIYNDLGNTDVFYGGAAIDLPLHARWTARTGAWWAPTSIPDQTFHLGIADFAAWDLRAGLAWQPTQSILIASSVDWYLIADREINNSGLSITNEASSGRVLPSANGEYAMSATRYGLSMIYRP
jgi:long-subunit fatty acid transport protein